MSELTRDDVKACMREVLADREILAPLLEPIVEGVVTKKMVDKIERTFGINCMNHADREATRKDMEWARENRLEEETPEGQEEKHAIKTLAKAATNAGSTIAKAIFLLAVMGLVVLGTLAVSGGGLREIFKKAVVAE